MINIDFFTCLYYNSSEYADNLYYNLQKTVSNNINKRFFALYKTGTVDKLTKNWNNIGIHFKYKDQPPRSGSSKHSQLLNHLRYNIPQDSDYTVICDCDVMTILRYWDKTILNIFKNDLNIVAVSTPKFNGVFSIFFTVFRSDFLRDNRIDFSTGRGHKYFAGWYTIRTEKEADIYKRRVGDKIVIDTANRVPVQIINLGYDYILMNLVGKRDYYINNIPCVSHLGGSNHKSFKNRNVQTWINKCKEYTK